MSAPDPKRLRRTGCCAVVFDEHGRILLHHRTDNGQWGLPGGSIETGESAEQSCIREVKEETGYDVAVTKLIGIYSHPSTTTITYPDGNVVAYVALAFECRLLGGQATLNDESSAIDWFDPANLPEPFLANHRPRVNDALARQTAAFYR